MKFTDWSVQARTLRFASSHITCPQSHILFVNCSNLAVWRSGKHVWLFVVCSKPHQRLPLFPCARHFTISA